jgi:hypothetical protein
MTARRGLGRRSTAAGLVVLACSLVLVVATGAGARAGWTKTTVASGLDSPRGLAFLPNGTILVAESGHGGDVCKSETNGGQTINHCIGTTSQLSSVNLVSGAHTPIMAGLFSSSVLGVTGADGLAVRGGQVLTAMAEYPQPYANWTCAGEPADCPQVLAAARAQAGILLKVTPAGEGRSVGSVGAFDYAWTQTNNHQLSMEVDANPYGVLATAKGTFVADAGSNTLDFVRPNRQIQLLGGVPAPPAGGFPSDGVPTCIAQAGGKTYVADLAGRLWTWSGNVKTLTKSHGKGKKATPPPTSVPLLTQVTVPAGVLHHVTGCTTDAAGNLYLVDMWGTSGPPIPAGPLSTANTGSVVMLAPNGTATTVTGGLNFPNGITRAKDGSLYVSVNSTCPTTGSPFPYCVAGGAVIHLTP